MSFPAYKNSFSEEVTDLPKTKFSAISKDDFLLNNTFEFNTKMSIADGSFKLKNTILTVDESPVKYNITNDATLEYFCKETKSSLRTKFKPKALQFQLDLPKYSLAGGSLNPYVRWDTSSSFTNNIPALGWVYIWNKFKFHVIL
jgi:hypothetical protein